MKAPNINILRTSRLVALGVGFFAVFAAIGSAFLGAVLSHGGYVAMACLLAGVGLASYLWWREAHRETRTLGNHIVALTFAIAAGLALYANLTWGLWMTGVPMELGTIRHGRMYEHYWLGPLTLLYAIVCYALLRWSESSSKGVSHVQNRKMRE
jgi:hypothetical protein